MTVSGSIFLIALGTIELVRGASSNANG